MLLFLLWALLELRAAPGPLISSFPAHYFQAMTTMNASIPTICFNKHRQASGDHIRMINLYNGSKKKKSLGLQSFHCIFTLNFFYVLSQRGVSGILEVSTKTWRLGSRGTYQFLFSFSDFFFNLGTDLAKAFLYGAGDGIGSFPRDWTGFYRCLICRPLATTGPPTREEDLISRLDDTTQFLFYGKA
ncbi:hypothetical protein F4803DRAFT_304948 [Xylaria telfairii]|nr:hypothetical protein F4803DRAFT_304948 [Xylaria telfairii]